MKILTKLAVGLAASLIGINVYATAFPEKPIKLVVGFAPGGPTDVMARAVANELSGRLGQSVVVENKPGAGTLIAAREVMGAAPDGYTLMYGTPTLVLTPLVQADAGIKVPENLDPISIVTVQPMGVLVSPSLGVDSFEELVEYARANPSRINFATSGVGTSEHLLISALSSRLGIKLTHVPYKGSGPVLTDLLAGRVHMTVNSLVGAPLEAINTGKLKLLALTGPERTKAFPDVPSLTEVGAPDFSFESWGAIFGPPGIPVSVTEKLISALASIKSDGKLQRAIEAQAMNVRVTTNHEARKIVEGNVTFFEKAIKDAEIETF